MWSRWTLHIQYVSKKVFSRNNSNPPPPKKNALEQYKSKKLHVFVPYPRPPVTFLFFATWTLTRPDLTRPASATWSNQLPGPWAGPARPDPSNYLDSVPARLSLNRPASSTGHLPILWIHSSQQAGYIQRYIYPERKSLVYQITLC